MKDIHFVFTKGRYWFNFLILKFNIQKARRGSPFIDVLLDLGLGWARSANVFDYKKKFFFRFSLLNFKVKEGDYKSSIFYQTK